MMRELMNGLGVGPVELIAGLVFFAALIGLCRIVYGLAWPTQQQKPVANERCGGRGPGFYCDQPAGHIGACHQIVHRRTAA